MINFLLFVVAFIAAGGLGFALGSGMAWLANR